MTYRHAGVSIATNGGRVRDAECLFTDGEETISTTQQPPAGVEGSIAQDFESGLIAWLFAVSPPAQSCTFTIFATGNVALHQSLFPSRTVHLAPFTAPDRRSLSSASSHLPRRCPAHKSSCAPALQPQNWIHHPRSPPPCTYSGNETEATQAFSASAAYRCASHRQGKETTQHQTVHLRLATCCWPRDTRGKPPGLAYRLHGTSHMLQGIRGFCCRSASLRSSVSSVGHWARLREMYRGMLFGRLCDQLVANPPGTSTN
jgi:hypothetical protein